jgi:hypothetical protein
METALPPRPEDRGFRAGESVSKLEELAAEVRRCSKVVAFDAAHREERRAELVDFENSVTFKGFYARYHDAAKVHELAQAALAEAGRKLLLAANEEP